LIHHRSIKLIQHEMRVYNRSLFSFRRLYA